MQNLEDIVEVMVPEGDGMHYDGLSEKKIVSQNLTI